MSTSWASCCRPRGPARSWAPWSPRAASDPELAQALRERVVGPRRAEISARLNADPRQLRVPADVAIDQLVGPLFHRALIVDLPIDEALLEAAVAGVVNE